jgi:cytoskeletal protein CcmA (bactofilin family)
MQQGAHIGPTVVIKGEISSGEPLSIAGQVEGKIDVTGHPVTIEAGGRLLADITGASITVAGSVKGTLVADQRIELHSTAEVEGDLSAPALSIHDGAYVLGKVEIAGKRAVSLPKAS